MIKPHLVLEWIMDCTVTPAILYTVLADDCKYVAHDGGNRGFTKTYQGVTSTVSDRAWEATEKFWISEQYGEEVGYFQPDNTREGIEPKNGRMENRKMGLGRDGEYLDHLARSQFALDGMDMTSFHDEEARSIFPDEVRMPVTWNLAENNMPHWSTPDRGLTVYKTLPTNNTFYNGRFNADHPEDGTWTMVPQPCAMQPFSKGRILSNYDEMRLAGAPEELIEVCKAGGWPAPLKPELQRLYILPTENTVPLTATNVFNIWE